MFKVGATYEFRMIEDGAEVTFWGTIEKYDHPLLKLEDVDPTQLRIQFRGIEGPVDDVVIGRTEPITGRIINVSSSNFVSAVEKRSGESNA